ncbi:extracellular solute-binding protein [Deinococcus sp. QL22]|uniref:extracellular solute-binding protein n=1 Tax=Deinococcus sp. QL22 TaxID=2939437 RepID=UPI0020178C54|nr:extracellular solute-binding protein [Deinococcus sp. QL22]UQN09797.1 extracellular solute-binding protein [Deinococcus sp. QL22]
MDALIAAFQKTYPNIKMTAEYFPIGTAYPQVLRTQLQSGNGADLFYVMASAGSQVSVLPLYDAGFVAPLTGRPWEFWQVHQGRAEGGRWPSEVQTATSTAARHAQ